MSPPFPLRQAEQLMDEAFTAKWRDRQALDPLPRRVLAVILERLIATGREVEVDAIAERVRGTARRDIDGAMRTLDDKDLILVRDEAVRLAYPLAAAPTPFRVTLADGRVRYAVCALDALGIAPLLVEPVTIHAACHHCREPLELRVRPDGPDDGDVVVWVGERGELRTKAFNSL